MSIKLDEILLASSIFIGSTNGDLATAKELRFQTHFLNMAQKKIISSDCTCAFCFSWWPRSLIYCRVRAQVVYTTCIWPYRLFVVRRSLLTKPDFEGITIFYLVDINCDANRDKLSFGQNIGLHRDEHKWVFDSWSTPNWLPISGKVLHIRNQMLIVSLPDHIPNKKHVFLVVFKPASSRCINEEL